MANSKYDDEKLKAIGLFKAGFNSKEISRELKVPYTTVRKWRPEADNLQTKQDLETILDTDTIIVHEVAEGVREKLAEIVDDGGELVDGVLETVDKLQALQGELQASATSALKKIDRLVDECRSADDLTTLIDSIAKLQTAFFSKGANVNVLNAFGGGQPSDTGMNVFKSLQRSA